MKSIKEETKVTIATNLWKEVIGRILLFLLAIPLSWLLMLSVIIFLVSLGHVNLYSKVETWFRHCVSYSLIGEDV